MLSHSCSGCLGVDLFDFVNGSAVEKNRNVECKVCGERGVGVWGVEVMEWLLWVVVI